MRWPTDQWSPISSGVNSQAITPCMPLSETRWPICAVAARARAARVMARRRSCIERKVRVSIQLAPSSAATVVSRTRARLRPGTVWVNVKAFRMRYIDRVNSPRGPPDRRRSVGRIAAGGVCSRSLLSAARSGGSVRTTLPLLHGHRRPRQHAGHRRRDDVGDPHRRAENARAIELARRHQRARMRADLLVARHVAVGGGQREKGARRDDRGR